MTHIGMLTPKRFNMERSIFLIKFFFLILHCFNITGLSLLEINRRVIPSPFHDDDDDDDQNSSNTNQFILPDDEVSSTTKKPKAWSVRARRDVPNILRGDR
jgi:hypothetical protein